MELDAILACLQRIEARLSSDEYEQGPILTVGGVAGLYVARSPFNTECEYMVIGALMAATSGNGSIVISGSNPAIIAPTGTYGLASGGEDNNAFDGYLLPVSATQSPVLVEHWQPLGRGLNVNVLVSGTSAFALIAFRRKLDRAIPAPPRAKPHTHSLPQSRRISRNVAQAGHERYTQGFTEPVLREDSAAIGNVEEMSPAQKVLTRLRNGGR